MEQDKGLWQNWIYLLALQLHGFTLNINPEAEVVFNPATQTTEGLRNKPRGQKSSFSDFAAEPRLVDKDRSSLNTALNISVVGASVCGEKSVTGGRRGRAETFYCSCCYKTKKERRGGGKRARLVMKVSVRLLFIRLRLCRKENI